MWSSSVKMPSNSATSRAGAARMARNRALFWRFNRSKATVLLIIVTSALPVGLAFLVMVIARFIRVAILLLKQLAHEAIPRYHVVLRRLQLPIIVRHDCPSSLR